MRGSFGYLGLITLLGCTVKFGLRLLGLLAPKQQGCLILTCWPSLHKAFHFSSVAKQYLLLKSDLVFARELLCESVVGRGYCLENKSNFV